jgi:phytoene synthase
LRATATLVRAAPGAISASYPGITRVQPEDRSAYLAVQAREHDPDRYLAALFAPGERRDGVLALVLLNHELARVPELVSQPMAGLIRYQWWRDALDEIAAGRPPRQHPVVQVLAEAHARGWLDLASLQALVDARERRLEGLAVHDLAALEDYVRATGGLTQAEIYRALGGAAGPVLEAARGIGTGAGLVGLVRALATEAGRQGGAPSGLLAELGVAPSDTTAARPSTELTRVAGTILERATALIAESRAAAGRPPRPVLAAFLPGRLAAAEAARMRRRGGDLSAATTSDRPPTAVLAMLFAWLARRA